MGVRRVFAEGIFSLVVLREKPKGTPHFLRTSLLMFNQLGKAITMVRIGATGVIVPLEPLF